VIGNIKLKPDARSRYVQMRFFGGPRDGESTHCVDVSELKGRIDEHYEFIGFSDVPPSAIYEWTK
jgi:hypothetical protein